MMLATTKVRTTSLCIFSNFMHAIELWIQEQTQAISVTQDLRLPQRALITGMVDGRMNFAFLEAHKRCNVMQRLLLWI